MTRRAPLTAVLLLAVGLRTWPWLQPHVFRGVQEYDDGVYYGAASLLLRGVVPYRDLTIVHPPAAALLLAPFAALGQVLDDGTGLAAARVFVLLVAVANVLLVYRCAAALPLAAARPRLAGLVAATAYAVLPGAVVAEHTVLLEPLTTLLCLIAVILLLRSTPSPRLLLAAGALLAIAMSTKAFGVAYLLVVAVVLVLARRGRALLWLGLGVTLGIAVVDLPFVLLAPGAFWHDVVVTQLSRPLDSGAGRWERLVDMAGLGPLPAVVGAPLLAVLVAVVVCRAWHARGPSYRGWVGLAVLVAVAFDGAASYFPHYGEFLAAPLAVLLAGAATSGHRLLRGGVALLLIAFLVGTLADLPTRGQGDLRALGARIPAGSCVFAESASVAIATGHLEVPTRDCPSWLDGRGVAYTQNTDWPRDRSFYFAGFTSDRRWQAALVDQLSHARFLLISRPVDQIREWSQSTRSYALATFSPTLVVPGDSRTRVELWSRRPGR